MNDSQTYLSPLEGALNDAIRVALNSGPSATRQLARRLIRSLPADSQNPVELRAALTTTLASAPPDPQAGLRRRALYANEVRTVGTSANTKSIDTTTETPILERETHQLIDRFISEHQNAIRLAKFGLKPSRRLLLTGPPGVGKTMTAHFIAQQLNLPIETLDLASVMSSHLGKSGQNLKTAISKAQAAESVLLIDEFDAVAKSRGDSQDVGELKRLVNVLLLELDAIENGIIIAATNHPELLDRAVERRFDSIIDIPLPNSDAIKHIIRSMPFIAQSDITDPEIALLALVYEGKSPAKIRASLTSVAREVVISQGSPREIGSKLIEASIADLIYRWKHSPTTRPAIAQALTERLGYSQRQAAKVLGVSHPTVSKALQGQLERHNA